jgi:hypothetical protein
MSESELLEIHNKTIDGYVIEKDGEFWGIQQLYEGIDIWGYGPIENAKIYVGDNLVSVNDVINENFFPETSTSYIDLTVRSHKAAMREGTLLRAQKNVVIKAGEIFHRLR